MRPWIVAAGVVLLVAAGLGASTAFASSPSCAARGPARLVGGAPSADGACARAEEDAAGATGLAIAGVVAALIGVAMPAKAAPAAGRACPACGRRLETVHGFCPGCGTAERREEPTRPGAR